MKGAIACRAGSRYRYGFLVVALATVVLAACGGGSDRTPFDSAGDVVVADFDGDGLDDVAATVTSVDGPPPHPGLVKVWLQHSDAPGTFESAGSYAVGPDPWQLRVGDTDDDGVPDLVAMSRHSSAVDGSPLVDVVTVLRGDPAQPGGFQSGAVLHAGARLSDIAVADLDADGCADIAFTSYNVDARLGVFWSEAGAFGAPETVVSGKAGALVAADLDGDDRCDLAYTVDDDAWVTRRDPATAHGFRSPVRVAGGSNLTCLTAADLDGDQLVELAVGSRETLEFGAPGELLTLHNASGELDPVRFEPLQTLPLTVHTFECVATDIDGDARPDLVTTGAGVSGQLFDDIVEVFLDAPGMPGRFADAIATVTDETASGYHIAVGKLDADERRDVVMPYKSGVLILVQDAGRPGLLLRGPELS